MQMSLCLRCPVVLDDVLSHAPFVDGNGWLVKDSEDLTRVLYEVESSPGQLPAMSARSLEIARQLLDYRKLAARIAMPATAASGSHLTVHELREI
jgi:1,2-diacylglycerol 3-alpha-glucosyltransferase